MAAMLDDAAPQNESRVIRRPVDADGKSNRGTERSTQHAFSRIIA